MLPQPTLAYLLDGVPSFLLPRRRKSSKRIDGNTASHEIGKILGGVYSRCCMAGGVGGDGRASSEQEFRRQDQARHAVGIAELFAHLCGAAKGILRQTGS